MSESRSVSLRLPADQRRRQLLDVALDEFAHDGFAGTSMNQIADAAGVTKPVLYQHFASKRALFSEVLEHVATQLADAIEDVTATAGSPREQVARGFGAYFDYVAANRNAFFVFFGGGTELDPEFAGIVRRFESDMADTIADLIDIDGVTAGHRRLLAHGIVGIAEVTSRNWLRAAGKTLDPSPQVLATQVSSLAWSGLRGIRVA